VLEWCSGPGYRSGASYPFQPRLYTDKAYQEELTSSAETRALRGGSWVNLDRDTRAACRDNYYPHDWINDVGFRVVELLSDPGF
jgi:formylglycine-generating enzyme required for sulfatase activity